MNVSNLPIFFNCRTELTFTSKIGCRFTIHTQNSRTYRTKNKTDDKLPYGRYQPRKAISKLLLLQNLCQIPHHHFDYKSNRRIYTELISGIS